MNIDVDFRRAYFTKAEASILGRILGAFFSHLLEPRGEGQMGPLCPGSSQDRPLGGSHMFLEPCFLAPRRHFHSGSITGNVAEAAAEQCSIGLTPIHRHPRTGAGQYGNPGTTQTLLFVLYTDVPGPKHCSGPSFGAHRFFPPALEACFPYVRVVFGVLVSALGFLCPLIQVSWSAFPDVCVKHRVQSLRVLILPSWSESQRISRCFAVSEFSGSVDQYVDGRQPQILNFSATDVFPGAPVQ